MVDFFLSYLTNEKRLSQHTVLAYKIDLKQFSEFQISQNPNFSLLECNYNDLRAWIVNLSDKALDNRSINRKIATLRSFFKFLLIKKKIETDPTLLLKALKTAKNLPLYLEEKPIENLFELIQFGNDFSGIRDKLIFEMLYGTGIRLSELIGIQIKDIDLFGKKIMILGKRSKYRLIPISNILHDLIKLYILEKSKAFQNSNEYFFVTDKNQKLYPVFVQRKVKEYLNYVTTVSKKSPHILRHTFATHLINRGADLNAIKELLGHSSLVATQIYTHNSINKLKEIHSQAHPKA